MFNVFDKSDDADLMGINELAKAMKVSKTTLIKIRDRFGLEPSLEIIVNGGKKTLYSYKIMTRFFQKNRVISQLKASLGNLLSDEDKTFVYEALNQLQAKCLKESKLIHAAKEAELKMLSRKKSLISVSELEGI